MEDVARLALLEQYVKDPGKFNDILQELLKFIVTILDNPHDPELRTIRSELLKQYLSSDVFQDYLKYIGFQLVQNELIYPKEHTLTKLRIAQSAIERKISLCNGPIKTVKSLSPVISPHYRLQRKKKQQLEPSFIKLVRLDPFLVRIRTVFNDVLKYEDEELQRLAREKIPLMTLQSLALARMREHQKKIKTGEIKGHDMSFDLALLMELMGWFKHKFFTWVDKPPCEACGGPTQFTYGGKLHCDTEEGATLEMYKCTKCPKGARFPRYNNPKTLLRTRMGRCGEWANCFTLFCRSLGYDTRYVYDTTDHVWCEVFDYESNTWMHVDPCEGAINSPLMYCHGWGKSISYVFAFSKDDLQDVTWKYTTNHNAVRARRTEVSEKDLLDTMQALRAHRFAQFTPARRAYLTVRGLKELVDMLVERKPTDYESHGRISGSHQWRRERGELGSLNAGYTFEFSRYGHHVVRYHTAIDEYSIFYNKQETKPLKKWGSGIYEHKNMFRKLEKDWRQSYLARMEGEKTGSIAWRFAAAGEDMIFKSLSIKLKTATYENGCIDWTIQFDEDAQLPVKLGEVETVFSQNFTSMILRAQLSGGRGDVAWQHAQLFRQSMDDLSPTFEVVLLLDPK